MTPCRQILPRSNGLLQPDFSESSRPGARLSPVDTLGRVGPLVNSITGAPVVSWPVLYGSPLREQICRFLDLFWVGMGEAKLPQEMVFSADITIILKPLPRSRPLKRNCMSTQKTIRIVTRGKNGELRTRDYAHEEAVLKMHTQIGIDDCSTDLSLRGLPVFRGLIGPMPESKEVVRYEAPEVFESLTKEWGIVPMKRKTRRRTVRK